MARLSGLSPLTRAGTIALVVFLGVIRAVSKRYDVTLLFQITNGMSILVERLYAG
jgi:hypothetical protein